MFPRPDDGAFPRNLISLEDNTHETYLFHEMCRLQNFEISQKRKIYNVL